MQKLHIDIETYSSVDLRTSGVYKYVESIDFEIMLCAYAFGSDPIKIVDLAQGEQLPAEFLDAMVDANVLKYAHSAAFERLCFKAFGLDVPINQWFCTAIHSGYCGLPLSLGDISKALSFDESKAKSSSGKALIRFFCIPCKPTKANGGRSRNLPEDAPDKWSDFRDYCVQDVQAERSIEDRLEPFPIPRSERELYFLDQKINDDGVLIDAELAAKAYAVDQDNAAVVYEKIKKLTGVDNPNSVAQLKEWLSNATNENITSLAKENVADLLAGDVGANVREVLRLRQMGSKSSIKKYTSMLNCICKDGRGHGFFQFYGASRTGRWAGRLVQLQNLTKNYLPDLTTAREVVKTGDYKNVEVLYGDVSDTLSQLIRTAFVAPEGKTFAVADFSAIEARVIAWVAGEGWRLSVFHTHGKIYEASAASMFGVPIESIGKGSPLRQKGKVAELALGYQGSTGALKVMGAEKMGLNDKEMKDIVGRWRKASPNIVNLWKDLEGSAKQAIQKRKKIRTARKGISFYSNGKILTVKLPSGRKLFYCNPKIKMKTIRRGPGDSWDTEAITYKGMDQIKRQWVETDTYGGKITENIVQAIARDLLAEAMVRLDTAGYKIVMHVHDEVVVEIPKGGDLEKVCRIMSIAPAWAEGLPLAADGYLTDYYKKD